MSAEDQDDKPDLQQFAHWLQKRCGEPLSRLEANYGAVTAMVLRELEGQSVWTEILASLPAFNDEYIIQKGGTLLRGHPPQLIVKPFGSFIDKVYRKNIAKNKNYPDPPDSGWLDPSNWYSGVGDIFRTTFTVSYLDGVAFLSDKICNVIDKQNCSRKFKLESRMEGYYAGHLDFEYATTYVDLDWASVPCKFGIEIQITTHVKEAVKSVLHSLYERERSGPRHVTEPWQWDFMSEEFITNNLGHIIHYVEGMIVRLREEQRKTVA